MWTPLEIQHLCGTEWWVAPKGGTSWAMKLAQGTLVGREPGPYCDFYGLYMDPLISFPISPHFSSVFYEDTFPAVGPLFESPQYQFTSSPGPLHQWKLPSRRSLDEARGRSCAPALHGVRSLGLWGPRACLQHIHCHFFLRVGCGPEACCHE